MKKQFENNNFILYSPDTLKYITNNMEDILNNSLELYKKLFRIKEYRQVQINYFDDIISFRKFIYDLRKEKESLPKYAKGTFDKGMINAYIEKDIEINSDLYRKKLYMASHELFHIMYDELILKKYNYNRIVWFDEGMAEFFSGEYDKEINSNFDKWFIEVFKNTKKIPDLNKLDHGNNFETIEYSGYNLSLLSIKYLYDILGFNKLVKLLYSNKIERYGKTIVKDAFEYYKKTFSINC